MDIPVEAACAGCGSQPAVAVTIRRHVGMIFLQRFFKLRRPLCRDCGTKLLKSFTLKTLWQGWWGYISFFVNWFVLAANLAAYLKIRALAQPRPAVATEGGSSEQWQSAFAAESERSE
jgi:hypothetical protein